MILKRTISVLVASVFIFNNLIFADGLSRLNYQFQSDKLASQSQISNVLKDAKIFYTGVALHSTLVHEDVTELKKLFQNQNRIKEELRHSIGDSVNRLKTLIFADALDSKKTAYYTFSSDGYFYRFTNAKDVNDPFNRLIERFSTSRFTKESVQIAGVNYYQEVIQILPEIMPLVDSCLYSVYPESLPDFEPYAEPDSVLAFHNRAQREKQINDMLDRIKQERANPGEGDLPEIFVISDYHGEANLFLKYVADSISQKVGKQITLDYKEFPKNSIAKQLSYQGVDIRKIGIVFFFLGDFLDRGPYGVKCFRIAEELVNLGIAEYVTGNHDIWAFLNLMGFHLPIYEGYNFYGHRESEELVKKHWNNSEIVQDRIGWWTAKLADYNEAQKKLQKEVFGGNAKVVREEFKEKFLNIQEQLSDEEKELLEDLVGFYFGNTDVYTGFNGVGMMSVQWWEEKMREVNRIWLRVKGTESGNVISFWKDIKQYTEEAYNIVKDRLDGAMQEGNWWWMVLNDINHQNYTSVEWWGKDWSSHSGWGTTVIDELNEGKESKKWTQENYIHNKDLQDLALFYRRNFTLCLKDVYGNIYTHGWLPVDEKTGQIRFTYQGVTYEGSRIWQGLSLIQSHIRDLSKPLSELHEALELVNSWYADKTTRIKPDNLKKYVNTVGLERIYNNLGIRVWVTGHNPLNKLVGKGIGFVVNQNGFVHVSVDKGMSWKKFNDIGGYVRVNAQGVVMRGFSTHHFDSVVDNPPIVVLGKNEQKETIVTKEWQTEPLSRDAFLDIIETQLKQELASLIGATPERLHLFPKYIVSALSVQQEALTTVDGSQGFSLASKLYEATKGLGRYDEFQERIILREDLLEETAQVLTVLLGKLVTAESVKAVVLRHEQIEESIAINNNLGNPFIQQVLELLKEYYARQGLDAEHEVNKLLCAFARNYAYLSDGKFPKLNKNDYQLEERYQLQLLRELLVHSIVENEVFGQEVRVLSENYIDAKIDRDDLSKFAGTGVMEIINEALEDIKSASLYRGGERYQLNVTITETEEFAQLSAKKFADKIRELQKTLSRNVNIVFATGNTMVGFLDYLSKEEGIDWKRINAFHLDEYQGLPVTHPSSFAYYLEKNIFSKVPIPRENIHFINGENPNPEVYMQYLRDSGGADLVLVGVGSDGHLAFNEPPKYSRFDSRMQIVRLTESTLVANEPDYSDIRKNPYAITMGMVDIFEGREIFFLANGAKKADIVGKAFLEPVTEDIPASMLQMHSKVTIMLDKSAAAKIEKKSNLEGVVLPNVTREKLNQFPEYVETFTKEDVQEISSRLKDVQASAEPSYSEQIRDGIILNSMKLKMLSPVTSWVLRKLGDKFGKYPALRYALYPMTIFIEWLCERFIFPVNTTLKDETKVDREIEKLVRFIYKKDSEGMSVTLDNVGDSSLSEEDADAYEEYYKTIIRKLGQEKDVAEINLSLKFSALVYGFETVNNSQAKYDEIKERLVRILQAAKEVRGKKVFIRIDMEEYEFRDKTVEIFKQVIDENPELVVGADGELRLGIVIQAYLRDSGETLVDLVSWAREKGYKVPVRLVKGAYDKYEKELARKEGRQSPVFDHSNSKTSKEATDANYELLSEFLIQNHEYFKLAFATHNIRSMAKVMSLAKKYNLEKNDFEFQMLYGMGDEIKEVIVDMGYNMRIYLPAGTMARGMKYAGRRFAELANDDNALTRTLKGEYQEAENEPKFAVDCQPTIYPSIEKPVADALSGKQLDAAVNGPISGIINATEVETQLSLDEAIFNQFDSQTKWFIDRLAKSTAGVRGTTLALSDTEWKEDFKGKNPVERVVELQKRYQDVLAGKSESPQLHPFIVALFAQAYANYIKKTFPLEKQGMYIGYDERLFSKEYAEIVMRVLAGNGIKVYRDADGSNATPVSSYMGFILGIAGSMEITSSHNPPYQNGMKSATWYGGVDTDDVSDKIAQEVHRLYNGGKGEGEILFGSIKSSLVQSVDAKEIYFEKYVAKLYTPEVIGRMKQAMDQGAKFMFDGICGVGGKTISYYLDRLFGDYQWKGKIIIINDKPDPMMKGILKPDPSIVDTLEYTGALDVLAENKDVLVSVTADMDADRVGTGVVISQEDVAKAKKFGLVVKNKKGVNIVCFTPNQIFTLIAYERVLQFFEKTLGTREVNLIKQKMAETGFDSKNLHLIAGLPISRISNTMIEFFGGVMHLTAVGFKNLGKEAYEIEQLSRAAINVMLLEESGGGQIGLLGERDDKDSGIHKDKDTSVLALSLYSTASNLFLDGRKNLVDFYINMAENLGGLFYYERVDVELTDDKTGADRKQSIVERAEALEDLSKGPELLKRLFAKDVVETKQVNIPNTKLLLKDRDGNWNLKQPQGTEYTFLDGEKVVIFHAGEGPMLTFYDKNGRLKTWTLIRPSGTENTVRVYLEVFEPFENPHPENLVVYYEKLFRYLGLDKGRKEGEKDYLTQLREVVSEKYIPKSEKVQGSHLVRVASKKAEKPFYSISLNENGVLIGDTIPAKSKKQVARNMCMLRNSLDRLEHIYGLGIFTQISSIQIVGNLESKGVYPDGRAPLASYKDGVLKIDKLLFDYGEFILFEELEHEFLESIGAIIPGSNDIVSDIVATYRNVMRFLNPNLGITNEKYKWNEKKYWQGKKKGHKGILTILRYLEKKNNPIDPDGEYLALLVRLKKLKEKGELNDNEIIASVVRYVMRTKLYENVRDQLGLEDDIAKQIRDLNPKLDDALAVFNEIAKAKKSVDLVHKVKSTTGMTITVTKTFTGLRVQGLDSISDKLAEMISALVKQISSADKLSGMLTKMETTKYILADKARLGELKKAMGEKDYDTVVANLKKNNFELVTEMPDGVELANVVRLVDPGDLEKMPQLDNMYYLPMPYTRGSLYMAANIVQAEGDLNQIPLVKELMKDLYKGLDESDLIALIKQPWKILPKIQPVIAEINNLRKAIVEIEKAA
jgi:glucosamine-6-phosphate isomerase